MANLLSGLVSLVVLWLSLPLLPSQNISFWKLVKVMISASKKNIFGKKLETKEFAILHYLEKGCSKYFLRKKRLFSLVFV